MPTPWAFVTGTSTGIGRAIVMRLLREGVSVFAGVRREADAESLRREVTSSGLEANGAKLSPVLLDVTKEEDIERAMETIDKTVGQSGLWALVNNAGIVVPGPVEHLSLADWRHQFDVNFFSVTALTRLALPLLRQGVRAHGLNVPRVMIVSSIGGRVAQPMLAPYTSSKWAVTALGDSLRLELRRQGIGVTVLEPGAIATAIWGKGDEAANTFTSDHPARRIYSAEIDGLAEIARKTAKGAISPEKAADVAVAALMRKRAPARVLVGADAKVLAFLRRWMPLSWFDALLVQQFGMGKRPGAIATSADVRA